jgi:hypothetical protein
MTPSGTSAGSGRATLVAAFPTPQAARIAWRAVQRRQLATVSILWLRSKASLEPVAAQSGSTTGRLVIEGDLLTLLRTEGAARAGLLGAVADDLRRLGLLESSLDHYARHLERGRAVLVAHGAEVEIEGAYRSVKRASLAIHHVSLD